MAALGVAIFAATRVREASVTRRGATLERSLNRRLGDLNGRVDDIDRRVAVEKSDVAGIDRREHKDITGLAGRLQVLENNAVKVVKASGGTGRRLTALTTRVDALSAKVDQRKK